MLRLRKTVSTNKMFYLKFQKFYLIICLQIIIFLTTSNRRFKIIFQKYHNLYFENVNNFKNAKLRAMNEVPL